VFTSRATRHLFAHHAGQCSAARPPSETRAAATA
jgi:hypothetical protein